MKIQYIVLLCFCVLFSSCTHAQTQEIKASEIVKLLKKGKNVEFANKIILNDLNFTEIENLQMLSSSQMQNVVESNIFFVNCVFMGNVVTNGTYKSVAVQTKFNNNLVFQNCDFRGKVDFENTVVIGRLCFNKAKFRFDALLNNMTIYAKDSYLSEIEAEGKMQLINSSFAGNLYLMDCSFQNGVSLQNATIAGKLLANGMKSTKTAEFDMMTVGNTANFNYSTFDSNPTFIQTHFTQGAEFVGDTLTDDVFKECKGEIRK